MPAFERPPSEGLSANEGEQHPENAKRRVATVYDAVAGRVYKDGLVHPKSSGLGHDYRGRPLRPDEVLFKQRNAPPRYEETDRYFAHTRLPSGQALPGSDLLKALHPYLSRYYARSAEDPNSKVWKSMDETALLALGILIEESCKVRLGETGDLAFLERAETASENEREDSDSKSNIQEEVTHAEAQQQGASDDGDGSPSSAVAGNQ
ncbi:hypothetical protein EJ04DRAFT_510047 [Polyplosphaeria fusca]|uniref:Uncharacterized protein n=1 Tax=Polyplosphaeria fusca TaxID=682080 RepID=A0A9P4R6H1_9PLEO|nr:hypothetical protein EJ04DRAFT_510047 [Polyplosphaeria fusca]